MIVIRKFKGLAALEMLFVLPILLLLLVTIFELGRMFVQYTSLNKALQNGVRSAVNETYGTQRLSDIADLDYIKSVVVYGNDEFSATGDAVLPGFSVSDVLVDSSVSGYVTVTANYDYVPIYNTMPIIGTSFNVTMTASTIMRTSP
ncbi:TadE/TadG family type IV pilus assembly protein [Vibrio breoganii]